MNVYLRFKEILEAIHQARKKGHQETPDLDMLQDLAKRYVGGGKAKLMDLEKAGFQIVPFNFYSPIPSVREIEEGWETRTAHPFLEPELYPREEMRDFVQNDLMPYSKEFNPDQDGSEENPIGFYWNNPSYSHSDAMSLYCFVRLLKPKRVIEVGGGFSTLVIDQAIKTNGHGEIWEVEPFPRPFLKRVSSITRFFEEPVQDLSLDLFGELEANDILFIDSTHTVKASSDCTFLYLKALNRLKPGVYIHSHDIFLPDSLPIRWNLDFQYYWAEHYLLQALLAHSDRFQIIYGSHYHLLFHKELLARLMADKGSLGGGSFWFKRM